MPMALLVDLVNGWGTAPRAAADGREAPPPAWLAERYGVPVALERGADRLQPVFAADPTALARVADRLYPVFAADGAGEQAALVSDLLARTGVRPALGAAGGRVTAAWLVPRERDALLAAAAVGLRAQLAEHGPDRLGTCADVRCGDAYVDASPGGHRRFCSVTCQNRARVAAFRRRRAGEDNT